MAYFDEREMTEVAIFGMQYFPEGETGVSAHVSFTVSTPEGEYHGPSLQTELFVQADKDEPLSSIQQKLVDRAYELVHRIASEDRSSLRKMLDFPQEYDFRKQ